jgi:hypothetical protein
MPRIRKWVGDLFGAIGVYIFTFLGIILSQYAPLLLKQGIIDTPFEWIRLGISGAIAFYIIASDESEGDEEGKKRNLKKRLAHAFTHGYCWNGLLGLAGQAAGAP